MDIEKSDEEAKKTIEYQIIDKLLVKSDKKSEKKHQKDDEHQKELQDQLSLSDQTIRQSLTENQTVQTNQSVNLQSGAERQTLSGSISNDPIEEPAKSDPLIFDLNGNGVETSGLAKGTKFDINADGINDQVSFVSGGDAFLAYDKNGNGVIDNGSELFGDQNGARNGYEELAKYDDNKDGIIDKNDQIYDKLKLFSLNSNQQQQLDSLSEHQIKLINLGYQQQQQSTAQGDTVAQISSFTRTDGSQGKTADLLLQYKP